MINQKSLGLLLIVLLNIFTACNKEEEKAPISVFRIDDYSKYNLNEAVQFTPELSEFYEILIDSDPSILSSFRDINSEITLFAFSNAALNKIGQNPYFVNGKSDIVGNIKSDLIGMHIYTRSTSFESKIFLLEDLNENLKLSNIPMQYSRGYTINELSFTANKKLISNSVNKEITIRTSDLKCKNGVIHIIDDVIIFPPYDIQNVSPPAPILSRVDLVPGTGDYAFGGGKYYLNSGDSVLILRDHRFTLKSEVLRLAHDISKAELFFDGNLVADFTYNEQFGRSVLDLNFNSPSEIGSYNYNLVVTDVNSNQSTLDFSISTRHGLASFGNVFRLTNENQFFKITDTLVSNFTEANAQNGSSVDFFAHKNSSGLWSIYNSSDPDAANYTNSSVSNWTNKRTTQFSDMELTIFDVNLNTDFSPTEGEIELYNFMLNSNYVLTKLNNLEDYQIIFYQTQENDRGAIVILFEDNQEEMIIAIYPER